MFKILETYVLDSVCTRAVFANTTVVKLSPYIKNLIWADKI